MLVVASLGLLVNIAGFLVLHGGDRKSLNMRGALLHVLGDMLGSVAAIVAALVIIGDRLDSNRSDPLRARCASSSCPRPGR